MTTDHCDLVSPRLRIGAVNYLNSKPLIEGLADLAPSAEMVLDYPSRLADQLSRGTLDVALVPSIASLLDPDYEVVSDACVATRGPVLSVKMYSRVPPQSITRLALDAGSRTSATLVRILLAERYDVFPQLEPLPLDKSLESTSADAILLIGDRAIHPPAERFACTWDLGEEWTRSTGLPFVFALWATRSGTELGPVEEALTSARDLGVSRLEQIARREAPLLGLSEQVTIEYLTRNLYYRLGAAERRGLARFQELAVKYQLAPEELSLSSDISPLLEKAVAGERLAPAEGLRILESHDLVAIGQAADTVTRRLHPEPYRTYNIDRNINYTNACTAVCDFCAFYRPPKHDEVYVLPREVLLEKIAETVALGGDQILMQGGLHPTLTLEWYEELLRDIKRHYPQVNIHGFSPPEIHHFTKISKRPLREVLERLQAAGLGSLPGGGGEILVDRVRAEITRGKVMTDDWLNVHRVWHQLGGKSSATMMFGHVETLAERIEHLERLRQLQDETGGFTAYICWTFQPENTAMAHVPPVGAFEYLKMQAVSRLYLDNVPNVQSSWVTQGEKIGQVALFFGANDMGSLMIEENVVSSAGTVHHLTIESIRRCIREAGYIPRQRNVFYEYLDEDPADAAGQPGVAPAADLPVIAGTPA